jgi:hypothetical protein
MTPQQINEAVKLVQEITDRLYKHLKITFYDNKEIKWKIDTDTGIFTVEVKHIEDGYLIEEKKILWNEIF